METPKITIMTGGRPMTQETTVWLEIWKWEESLSSIVSTRVKSVNPGEYEKTHETD